MNSVLVRGGYVIVSGGITTNIKPALQKMLFLEPERRMIGYGNKGDIYLCGV